MTSVDYVAVNKESDMKCPQCTAVMAHTFRQQGGVRTHEQWECDKCSLLVSIMQKQPETKYASPIESLLKMLGVRNR